MSYWRGQAKQRSCLHLRAGTCAACQFCKSSFSFVCVYCSKSEVIDGNYSVLNFRFIANDYVEPLRPRMCDKEQGFSEDGGYEECITLDGHGVVVVLQLLHDLIA